MLRKSENRWKMEDRKSKIENRKLDAWLAFIPLDDWMA